MEALPITLTYPAIWNPRSMKLSVKQKNSPGEAIITFQD
jgi:hypothetical protein